MSKEPVKREVEQDPAKPEEGWKHGYTEAQIKVIEDARGDDTAPPPIDDGLDAQREKAAKEAEQAAAKQQRDAKVKDGEEGHRDQKHK